MYKMLIIAVNVAMVILALTPAYKSAPTDVRQLFNDSSVQAQAKEVGSEISKLIIDLLEKQAIQNAATPSNVHLGYPRDCLDAYRQGHTLSGRYTIQPDYLTPFEVFCCMENGGGWAVIQKRSSGKVTFDRQWDDYVKGFGNVDGEYWLGLHKIYRLTRWKRFAPELRIALRDFSNEEKIATYDRFFLDGSDEQYRLHVSGFDGPDVLGDSLSYHDGQKFSTTDRDNDELAVHHCGIDFHSGWWFKTCFHANLNGVYYNSNPVTRWHGIQWDSWKGDFESLKTTEMKIRTHAEEYTRK